MTESLVEPKTAVPSNSLFVFLLSNANPMAV